MLPRWHVLLGAIFTLIIWLIFPQVSWIYLTLIFLSSFLIDFDHYATAVFNTKKFSLKDSFNYYKILGKKHESEAAKGIRKKGVFHLFHTLEFHLIVFLLGFIWQGFFYIFLGMLFHSGMDIIYLVYKDRMYLREFFFINWLRRLR